MHKKVKHRYVREASGKRGHENRRRNSRDGGGQCTTKAWKSALGIPSQTLGGLGPALKTPSPIVRLPMLEQGLSYLSMKQIHILMTGLI